MGFYSKHECPPLSEGCPARRHHSRPRVRRQRWPAGRNFNCSRGVPIGVETRSDLRWALWSLMLLCSSIGCGRVSSWTTPTTLSPLTKVQQLRVPASKLTVLTKPSSSSVGVFSMYRPRSEFDGNGESFALGSGRNVSLTPTQTPTQTTTPTTTPTTTVTESSVPAPTPTSTTKTKTTKTTTTTTTTTKATTPNTLSSDSPPIQIHRLPFVRRVHCISDLHVDHRLNMDWWREYCEGDSTAEPALLPHLDETDLMVVAGDISHELDTIETSLRLLKGTGAHVVFVPGNHEAWLSSSSELDAYDQHPFRSQENSTSMSTSTSTSTSASTSTSSDKPYSSLDKLEDIEQLCKTLGVMTTGSCVCVGGRRSRSQESPQPELWILPLDGWYDGSLSVVDLNHPTSDTESGDKSSLVGQTHPHYELVDGFRKWPWVDFVRCRWPQRPDREEQTPASASIGLLAKIPHGLVEYFVRRNQRTIDAFQEATATGRCDRNHEDEDDHEDDHDHEDAATVASSVSILTVSHFLPNRQCLPDWKDLGASEFCFDSWLDHGAGEISAKFALVAGSDQLDRQIRSIALPEMNQTQSQSQPNFTPRRIHVFGHSHRPKDFVYEGIRYVHQPLGKPRERDMYMCDPNVQPKLVWDADTVSSTSASDANATEDANNNNANNNNNNTIIRYWEEHGGGLEMLRIRMGKSKRKRRQRYGRYNPKKQK